MSTPEVILNLQKILKTIEPSYFTNNYSNKNELLDHIYKKHSELTTIKEIEEKKLTWENMTSEMVISKLKMRLDSLK